MRSERICPSMATISCCSAKATRRRVGPMVSAHIPSCTPSHRSRTVIGSLTKMAVTRRISRGKATERCDAWGILRNAPMCHRTPRGRSRQLCQAAGAISRTSSCMDLPRTRSVGCHLRIRHQIDSRGHVDRNRGTRVIRMASRPPRDPRRRNFSTTGAWLMDDEFLPDLVVPACALPVRDGDRVRVGLRSRDTSCDAEPDDKVCQLLARRAEARVRDVNGDIEDICDPRHRNLFDVVHYEHLTSGALEHVQRL
jgi:hypothetical protein